MEIEVKNILIKSLREYSSKTVNQQTELVKHVEKELVRNKEATERIGFGLDSEKVKAGEIFLRYINLHRHIKNQLSF